jgi:hypothetical protein
VLRPALLIALALALAALAGCGGGGSAGTTGGASGPARQSSNPPEATEPGQPAKPGHGAVGEVRMLGLGSGWAIADGELLWTEDDGREWRSITPPGGERVGVDFLDRRHGWVATRGSEGPNEHLSIYFTPDGGVDWSKATVHGAGGRGLFIGGMSFSFTDPARGWALLSPPHSMGVEPPGTLFRTHDGGRVWNRVGPTPVSGTVEFTSAREGWNLGDSTATGLFRTTDGGRHWRRVRVRVSAADRGEGRPEYALPLRLGGGRLVFPVNLHAEKPNGREQDLIALYRPSSAGWHRVAQAPLKGSIGGGLVGSVSLRPPDSVVIRDPGAARPILLELSGSRPRRSALAASGLPANTLLGFGDARYGGATYVGGECTPCEESDDAFFTSDGGRTWSKRAVFASDPAADRVQSGRPASPKPQR